jgi:hypothetical protein
MSNNKSRSKRNTSVLLWGKKKASQEQINDVLNKVFKKVEVNKPTKKNTGKKESKDQRDYYDPTLEYNINDIDFLESEYDKINEDYNDHIDTRLKYENIDKYYNASEQLDKIDDPDDRDEKVDEILGKMIDKLELLIEVLKDYAKVPTKGSGLGRGSKINLIKCEESDNDSDSDSNSNFNPFEVKERKVNKEDQVFIDSFLPKILDKSKSKAKSTSANMIINDDKPLKTKKVDESKVRVEKGSNDAHEKMAKLRELKVLKNTGKKEEKDKIKEAKNAIKEAKNANKKPFYYIGKVPSGYRKATEDEAIYNEMVGEYGENVVDPVKMRIYEKYQILVTKNKTPSQIVVSLKGITKRIDNIFKKEDDILSSIEKSDDNIDLKRLKDTVDKKISKDKNFTKTREYKFYLEKIEKLSNSNYKKGLQQQLSVTRNELKNMKRIYRFYQELFAEKTNTPVKPVKEFKRPDTVLHENNMKEIHLKIEKNVAKKKYINDIPNFSLSYEERINAIENLIKILIDEKQLDEVGELKSMLKLFKQKQKEEKYPEHSKVSKHYTFENNNGLVNIPKNYFDDKMVLKNVYADKLHKKNILLHPHYYDEEDTKKYFYTHVKGKGIGSYDLQKLLKQSYTPTLGNVGDYMVDDEISNPTTQVYRNKNTDKIYVVHRGTKGARDWLNNLVYGLSPSLYTYTDRYKNAKDIQEKAMNKYKGYDIDVLGHSQGAKLAEMISKDNKNVKNIITYNRPQGLMENLTNKPKNLYDIKTSGDLVSPLIPYQRGNQTTVIPSQTYNPLYEHQTERILDLKDHMIGTGFVNRKPDLNSDSIIQSVVFSRPAWTKTNAVKWLKEHNFYYDDCDLKSTQIRFRQYNPEDLKDKYSYITKPLKDNNSILLIIGVKMRNLSKNTMYRSDEKHGGAIMFNNITHYTPQEALLHNTKLITKHVQEAIKEHKALGKEASDTLNRTKKTNKIMLNKAVKGSKEMADKMARLRAMKRK